MLAPADVGGEWQEAVRNDNTVLYVHDKDANDALLALALSTPSTRSTYA